MTDSSGRTIKTYVVFLEAGYAEGELPEDFDARREFLEAAMGTVRESFTRKFNELVEKRHLANDLVILNVMDHLNAVVIAATDEALNTLKEAAIVNVTTIVENNADFHTQKNERDGSGFSPRP